MNKSYRVVWNASTSTWCAASEMARGRSKSSRSAKSKIAAATALLVASMGSAYADEVDAPDPTFDDPIHLADAKQDGPVTVKRSGPDTRAVVPDNSAYVKINAKGDGTDNALALGDNSIAIGSSAKTRPSTSGLGGAVAVGTAATAAGNNVAFGANASALGDEGAVALGAGANAAGKSSIALGNEAQATGWGAYALGRKAKATAESALAIGDSSMATRTGTMAIGSQAAAAAENAIAIGQSSAARGTDSLALGSYSEANRDQTVSVGTAGFERQIVNVGRGTQATDAVNVAQLKGVTDALGGNAAVGADGNIKKPAYTIGSKTYDNVGDALLAVSASGGAENAVEYDSTAKDSVTLGGTGAAAAKLTNVRAGTLSSNSTDAVNGAQLFGTNNRVTKVEQSLTDSGLIDPSTGESLAVVYKDATKSTVALGGTGGTVVTNVKAGKVAPASKDAVNGSQLYDVSASVASALGGESAVNADGTLSKPTYKVGDKTYNNVGDALQAAATSGGAGGEDVNAVHYDGANKSSVTLGGTGASSPVSLKNVATGQAATDAVNVAQLQSGLSDVKDEIKQNLGDGTLDMKYIKVRATGMQANALGKNSVAIGSQANATNVDTLAIGSGSRASGMNSIAIGVNSVAASADTVSIGDVGATRRIVNVSDGVDDTDAVNMKQLTDAMHSANTKLDAKMMRMTRDVESKPGSFVAIEGLGADGSLPNIASMNGRDPKLGTAAAIGVASGAGGINSVAVGLQAVSSSDYAVAIGSVAQTGVEQPYSVAMGSMVTTNGAGALAIGSRAKANADNAVAVGNNGVVAVGKSSIAIGDKAMTAAGTVNSVAMGKSANVAQNVTDAIALGANANVASGNNGGIALGANSVADRGNALSVGSNSLQRQIVNVAKGTKNNDAVNVSQLTGVTTALGGGAGIDADGTVKAPTYKVGDTTYNNVGDALDAMAKNGGSDPNAVAYDSDVKDKVTLAGKTGTTLTNVKAGALSATSTDAVNGSQLFATNESLGNLKDALKDGGVVDETTGESLAVVYDGTSKDKVTLAGKTGTTLSNVKAGTADLDAVNVSQLKASGLIGVDGKSIAAVTYDKKADGTPNYGSVTLGDGKSTGPVTLSNVAKGTAGTDAVNVDQLTKAISEVEGGLNPLAVAYDSVTKDKVTLAGKTGTTLTNLSAGKVSADSKDAVNGSQLYDTAQSVADTLGGGSTVDANGKVKAPTYSLTDPADSSKQVDYHNVGSALENLDDRVAGNTGDITHIKNQFTNTGLVDGDGDTRAAVTYDKNADGTANYKSATLAGEGGTTLTNVKAGALSATSTDAVNGSQLFATNESLGNLKDALKDGGVVDETTGESLAVVYDGTSKDKVTLAGKTGTTLSNVRAGTADLDAVNVSQLKASGLIGVDGKSIAAVTYDKKADGTPNYGSVTLGDGKSTGPVTLSNVAKGTAGTDAVNVDQLNDLEDSLVNGAIKLKYIKVNSEGRDAIARGPESVAIGANAWATRPQAMALGSGSRANGANSVAIGFNSVADDDNTVAVGNVGEERRIVHVANGVDDTDAVNMKQLTDAMHTANTKLDAKMTRMTRDVESKPGGFVAIEGLGSDGSMPNIASMNGRDPRAGTAAAIGVGSGASGINSISVGLQAVANSDNSVAIGSIAQTGVEQPYAVAMGSMVTTNGAGALAIGSRAKANAENAVAVGNNGVTAVGKSSIAIGDKALTKSGAVNSIAIGTNANVQQNVVDAIALGANSQAQSSNSIALGANSIANRANALSIGTAGAERQIVHVAKGTQDTDAVSLAQLKGLANVVGGGTGFDTNGDVTAPTYTIDGKEYHNVNDALQAAAKSGGDGSSGTDPNAVAYDGDQKDKVTLAGQNGTTLSNVAAGKVDTDAVNVSQLKSSGLIDKDGNAVAAMTYDKNADGTPNYKSATLAGEGGTKLSNVAAGTLDTDAVNVSQLKSSGLIGENGKALAAVTYDTHADGTTNFASVTFGGANAGMPVALHNVAAGKASTDAVNVSQLTGVTDIIGGGAGVDANGKVTAPVYNVDGKDYASVGDAIKALEQREGGNGTNPNAVVYDNATKAAVTLAGTNGTVIRNVADGSLALDSTEAVNGGQLNFAASSIADSLGGGAKFDPTTGDIEAPTYELTAADGLKNTYDNVGDAFKHVDERVTTHTAQIETLQQGVANAVQYDDATHASVTLGGVGVAPVMLKNVADGVDETDAVNVRQLRSAGLVGEDGKLQSAVVYDKNADGTTNYGSVTLGGKGASAPVALHNVAAGTAKTDAVNVSQLSGVTDALGGGAKVDETTGEIVAPTYNVGDKTFHNAGDALTNIDNRVSQIQNNLGETTKLVGAVAYDKNGDGTVNWGKVTLGNGPSSGPVVLTNVENGKSRYDAVNYGQFSDLQGRVDKIDDRLTTMTTPGDGNGGKPGTNGNDLIQGTGGSGKDSAEIVAAKPGTGNGNIAVGSGAQVADAKNNGTAIGAGSKVQADDGTALGHGATVSSGATNSVALGSGSKATEANTVSFGSDGHERRLVNVADGINKTDAVNRGQLDRAIGGMQGQINDMSRNAYSGIAAATALTMIPGVDPGKTLSFGVAGASYKGYQAVAMGGEARITENLKMRAGVSLSSGGNTFGAGASYQW
ncbi:YadA-like family protein [Burkholderia cenocepacia]|uniref:YadA-like family protein n=6 Tax=Burkholderia cenocepacia TaxID=95486 RepID=UPI00155917F0|nr:YadA-like family protein [Burkholderia cenocepacia]